MALDQGKAIARQFFEDAFGNGQLAILDQILAPDYVDHNAPPGLPPGPDGIKILMTTFRTAFPDLRFQIEDQVTEGDRVVTRYTFHGTHQGELMGIPPTGKIVAMPGISIYRIANGKMREAWVQYDTISMLQQLGAMPAQG
jgi:steroid delta-isomerase-like uncharacterized protein